MASQRFNNVGVSYLKCDHPGCTTLPAEFSDTNGGLEQTQWQGWNVNGQVLCPAHNHQTEEPNATDYWSKRLRGVNAKSRDI